MLRRKNFFICQTLSFKLMLATLWHFSLFGCRHTVGESSFIVIHCQSLSTAMPCTVNRRFILNS